MDEILAGCIVADKATVQKKIEQFALGGPESMHVVSDFDLTLTMGKVAGENAGTWDVMDELMPAEGVARHTAIYQSFRPIELQGMLTAAIAEEKWAETLDLITGYHMKVADIRDAFLRVAALRDGGRLLFDTSERYSIPTVVLSSGITNVIEIMADHYDIHPKHILSNRLLVGADGRIAGWDRSTLIHILNKREMGHAELTELRAQRPNVILLGDVPDDAHMVEGTNDVLRIRVLDPRKGERHAPDAVREASFSAGYDLLVEHSLLPVTHLVQAIASQHPF